MVEDQRKLGTVCVRLALAMKEYAELGTDDANIVGRHITDAMHIASDHLTENNQQAFADWLIKKTNEMKEEEVRIYARVHRMVQS